MAKDREQLLEIIKKIEAKRVEAIKRAEEMWRIRDRIIEECETRQDAINLIAKIAIEYENEASKLYDDIQREKRIFFNELS